MQHRQEKKNIQPRPWILLAKNNGMLPPPCPMHKILIGFLPQTALSRLYLQDAMVANPAETMLFTSVEEMIRKDAMLKV